MGSIHSSVWLLVKVVAVWLSSPQVTVSSGHYSWELAPSTVLRDRYFAYELCVLALAYKGQYQMKHNVHTQPDCLHLIDDHFRAIPKRCWLGSRQQRVDDGVCLSGKATANCRGLQDRPSFIKHWSHLKRSARNKLDYAGELADEVRRAGFTTLAFAGDSMAIQLSQRFVCDFIRRNVSFSKHWGDFFSMDHTGSAGIVRNHGYQIAPSQRLNSSNYFDHLQLSKADQLHNVNYDITATMYRVASGLGKSAPKANPKCWQEKQLLGNRAEQSTTAGSNSDATLFDQCIERESALIYKKTLASFNPYLKAKKWPTTLHIYMLPIISKEPWEVTPLVSAVLEAARQLAAIGSKLIIMTPFAQHFPGSSLGAYSGPPNSSTTEVPKRIVSTAADTRPPVCVAHTEEMMVHPEATSFLTAMNKIDRQWRRLVGWIDVTRYSIPWYDLHPESRASGWLQDCTHYGYNPMMYDVVWSELAGYVRSKGSEWSKSMKHSN